MSVVQIKLWTCDLCGVTAASTETTWVWADPVVTPLDGWSTEFNVPEQYRSAPGISICDACPKCQQAPDWTKYREAR